MKTEVVQVTALGGPEVLAPAELELEPLAPGAVRVAQSAVGLNFIDVYYRTGLYPGPAPPFVPGFEGAGEIIEVGEGVDLPIGTRVAHVGVLGAYAGIRDLSAERLVLLPDEIDEVTAAAVLLKGLTAWYLVRACRPVVPGEWVLVHAAAGGVGQLLCRWAAHLGARVIGTAGSEPKLALAREAGCEVALRYDQGDWASALREATSGEGVAVAYDSVGAATFTGTLDSLARRGTFVSFGNSSGPAPPVEPLDLTRRGSLHFTRPTLWDYVPTTASLRAAAAELFGLVSDGTLPVLIGSQRPLTEAGAAHAALEARLTTGSTVLLPGSGPPMEAGR